MGSAELVLNFAKPTSEALTVIVYASNDVVIQLSADGSVKLVHS